jgi:predicted Zn-dependent protease
MFVIRTLAEGLVSCAEGGERGEDFLIPVVIAAEKHIAYALGYLQLGLLVAAREELAALTPEARVSAPALATRLEIAMAEETWAEVVALAPDVVRANSAEERPWICWAYALRELQRVEEAQRTLLAGARLIKKPSTLVPYNLACYACLLGELPEARRLLDAVIAREKHWAEEARHDPDLAALFSAETGEAT